MECYEKGIISKEDTDGIDLTWGNASALVSMIEKMGKREGFGAVLADGVQKAAERIGKGSDKYAIHIHGMEPGYHDPRLYPVRGLGYIGLPRPGRHGEGMPAIRLSSEKSVGPYPELKISQAGDSNEDMARQFAMANSYFQVFSDSGLCQFAFTVGTNFLLADAISAATGWDFTTAEVILAGKRIITLRHAFNMREGLAVNDFKLPDRIAQPATTGPFAGRRVDYDGLKTAYFTEMGWDIRNGQPSVDCLKELGLQEMVKLS
jgi:aldehyde:ferredoxin oxidoreductase